MNTSAAAYSMYSMDTVCTMDSAYLPAGSIRLAAPIFTPARVFTCPYCDTVTEWRGQDVPPKKCWACGAPRK